MVSIMARLVPPQCCFPHGVDSDFIFFSPNNLSRAGDEAPTWLCAAAM